jgi:UPF0176 protein
MSNAQIENNFIVLLFYKYTEIQNPEEIRQSQWNFCQDHNLKGRIIVANEGINGTLAGKKEDVEAYQEYMNSQELFQNIHWKKSLGKQDNPGSDFPKLSVKVRKEVVSAHLGSEDLNPNNITGKYLQPEELNEWFLSGKKFYIVDMRNDYEQIVGTFENAILSQFANFRDLPQILPKIDHLKNETILTVCTGGIRCEKASGFLVQNGFTDVYQLYGGIVSYMEKYPNRNFLGKLYVFDQRVVMGFNTDSPNHIIIGKCQKCGETSENYVNCSLPTCHKHFICCTNCLSSKSIFANMAFCNLDCEKVMEEKMSLKA